MKTIEQHKLTGLQRKILCDAVNRLAEGILDTEYSSDERPYGALPVDVVVAISDLQEVLNTHVRGGAQEVFVEYIDGFHKEE